MTRDITSVKVDYTQPGTKVTESHKVKFAADEDIKALLIHQVKRAVTKLFKAQLTQLEDLRQEHDSSLKKVNGLIDEDFIKMINFFDEEKHAYFRKKVLDSGNETIRDLENLLENFEIRLK